MRNELSEPVRLERYDLDADHPIWLAPDFHSEIIVRTPAGPDIDARAMTGVLYGNQLAGAEAVDSRPRTGNPGKHMLKSAVRPFSRPARRFGYLATSW